MAHYICVHGHFYQPPRENPWLEAIETQDSAYPYHDWNERVTAECYAPNGRSRILDEKGRIVRIANNYARISFNFGPTLLKWMEEKAPELYQTILEADRASQGRFSGHGSALAQAYNHMILPLANRRDQRTQVEWGIRDFERRFGRPPEGMWLPETAVHLETLETLAELGIRFTVLAPQQAAKFRVRGARSFQDAGGGKIDPRRAYLAQLRSGRNIALFFYDGGLSQAVAFEKLLNNGENFAQRLLGGFDRERQEPQLVHIATDGESYGHHHPHGDMALAYALDFIESNGHGARLTNYGEFLEQHPPQHEARIRENTAWSCAHGIERWRGDCGCGGGRAGWNQQWRGPLRSALDFLRDSIAEPCQKLAGELLRDPWKARDQYISVVLDRPGAEQFLAGQAARDLSPEEKVRALKLLEMQRHAMLMYTSCGWFFEELSGIETLQVIFYAGRVLQLAQELFGLDEAAFLERLAQTRSNLPEAGDGAQIYRRWVKPAVVDLKKVGAHYAISSLFRDEDGQVPVFCHSVERRDYRSLESGRARLAVGNIRVRSQITLETAELEFCALHLGDHHLSAVVRARTPAAEYETMAKELTQAFSAGDFTRVVLLLDKNFSGETYSLASLFRDEQRRILNLLLDSTLAEAESSYRRVLEDHAPLMRFLAERGMPQPKVLRMTAEFVVNASLRRAFEEDLRLDYIRALLEQARREDIPLDAAGLAYTLGNTLNRMMDHWREAPDDLQRLQRLEDILALAPSLPFQANLWRAQNVYYEMAESLLPRYQQRQDAAAREWMKHFANLGERLAIRLPQPEALPLAG